jgi:Kef-type K+ transport system membrane component KefB
LFAAVASLSLVVVITEIGRQARNMSPEVATALVGAMMLSVLLFPTIAGILLSRGAREPAQADVCHGVAVGDSPHREDHHEGTKR